MAQALNFFDVKAKKKFKSDNYEIKKRNNRKFAVAISPLTGIESWRILPQDFEADEE